jgi:hypothetical protein
VIPNPWDVGSTRILAGLGFKALATSSAASASTLGRKDGDLATQVLKLQNRDNEMKAACAGVCTRPYLNFSIREALLVTGAYGRREEQPGP